MRGDAAKFTLKPELLVQRYPFLMSTLIYNHYCISNIAKRKTHKMRF